MARTAGTPAACPHCGQLSDRVHAYHQRQVADLPVGGRAVIVQVRVRRLVCAAESCSQRTFREQVPALAQRWARRTLYRARTRCTGCELELTELRHDRVLGCPPALPDHGAIFILRSGWFRRGAGRGWLGRSRWLGVGSSAA
ncbi:transposase family protein [Micromonospora tulbaghiae]|uniref:transposase family protein n=1 Tax=Micromonospora tulbaghiae TaxID=479978 RepID=UPI003EB84127